MTFPSVPANYAQERLGIAATSIALARMGLIWRETPTGDVGIDGQIEYTDADGRATGQLVAVQVKSGESYLKDGGDCWRFYALKKHRFYWERSPLPVLVFLHQPSTDAVYWTDARQVLRTPSLTGLAYIPVPKTQVLHSSTKEALFGSTGVDGTPFLSLEQVLVKLVQTKSRNASFPVSFLDLFANGMTNLCRTLFFGMDLALAIAEGAQDEGFGVGMGPDEHDFLFRYTKFVVAQHLADVPFSDCLIDWYDRELQPTWLAPLTSRGRELVGITRTITDELEKDGKIEVPEGLAVAQEDGIQMSWAPSHFARLKLIRAFGKALERAA